MLYVLTKGQILRKLATFKYKINSQVIRTVYMGTVNTSLYSRMYMRPHLAKCS